jgi:hypothetical protein
VIEMVGQGGSREQPANAGADDNGTVADVGWDWVGQDCPTSARLDADELYLCREPR